jgi:ribonuclease HII
MAVAEVSVAHASVEEIDSLNILRASHLAMERAVAGLVTNADHALIDGNLIPRALSCPAKPS